MAENPFYAKFSVTTKEQLAKKWTSDEYDLEKIYTDISIVLNRNRYSVPNIPSDVEERDATNYIRTEQFLEEILRFDEENEDSQFDRVDVFAEALRRYGNNPTRRKNKTKNIRNRNIPAIKGQTNLESTTELTENSRARETSLIIMKVLCRIDPHLPFDNYDKEGSAFHNAVEKGYMPVLQIIKEELSSNVGSSDTAELQDKAAKSLSLRHKGKTVMQLATENLNLDIIKLLLDCFPSLSDIEALRSIVAKTGPDEKDQDRKTALQAFEHMAEVMGILGKEMTKNDDIIWEKAVRTPSEDVLRLLLEGGTDSKFATYSNAEIVIKEGDAKMWDLFDFQSKQNFMSRKDCNFLHIAVLYRKSKIVEDILRKFPSQIEVNLGTTEKPNYPLQQLLKDGEKLDETTMPIRNSLLHAMIHSEKLDLSEIRNILTLSKVEASQMSLHLATVNTSEHSFSKYVQLLQKHESSPGSVFKFESILKHASFPDLDSPLSFNEFNQSEEKRLDHKEIENIFKWLKGRGVQTVLELSVLDRLDNPHSDDIVATCVNEYNVRILKWKKLDIYLKSITNKENLQELYLYSSGNRSVHDQWYEQLHLFQNLKSLHIQVVKDVMSETRANIAKLELSTNLAKIVQRLQDNALKEESRLDPFTLKIESWNSDKGFNIPQTFEEVAIQTAWPKLDAFVHKFLNYYTLNPTTRKTKVAIIDSGVVLFGGINQINSSDGSILGKDLAHRIVTGISLVSKDNIEQLYWHASEPHGTQMARLICSINSCCELYIVKVAETRNTGVTANIVAAAIDWARQQEVDVISLSLAVYGDSDGKMAESIRRAKDADIVLVSSTADQGNRPSEGVAMDQKLAHDVISIAACDWYGNPLEKSQKGGFNYMFVGQNVPVGLVPFLKSTDSVSGSSVATALAAGTASLILACCHISRNCQVDGTAGKWRVRIVEEMFKAMSSNRSPPWVDLENFCGRGKDLQAHYDFESFVDDTFKFGASDSDNR